MENFNNQPKKRESRFASVRKWVGKKADDSLKVFRGCSNKVLAYIGWTVCVLFVANIVRERVPELLY